MLPFLLVGACFALPHVVAGLGSPPVRPPPVLLFGDTPAALLRLRLRAPLQYSEAVLRQTNQKGLLSDVAQRIRAMGWRGVELVTQDPTDGQIFTVLTRGRGAMTDGVLRVEGVEPVGEPGARSPMATRTTDPGLTEEEVWAIQTALAKEMNPRHLGGFAGALAPHFPVAQGLLCSKSCLLEGRIPTDAPTSTAAFESTASLLPGPGAAIDAWKTLLGEAGAVTRTGTAAPRAAGPQLDGLRDGVLAYAVRAGVPRELILPEVKRAICTISEGHFEDLRVFPREVVEAAKGCLWTSQGVLLACPASMARMFPASGGEGYVSAAALQLALAEMKPEMAGVESKGRVPLLMQQLESESGRKDVDAMKARAMVEKAERAIERGRWVDWYRTEEKT